MEPTGFYMDDGKTPIDVEKDVGKLKGRDFEGSISKMTMVSDYTVTFYDQVTYTDIICKVGDRIPKPADPEMTGYTFQYWMDEKGCEFDFEHAVMPARNVLLTAYWKHNIMTVTFDTGEGRVFTDTCAYSGIITLPDPGVSPAGKTFSGWQTEGDKEIHAVGDEYTVTSDITFNGVWNAVICAVTYKTGAGSDIVDRYASGTAIALLDGSGIPNPGHRLIGWKSSDGTVFLPGSGYTVIADVGFAAIWEGVCTVTYVIEQGTEISETYKSGEAITLPDGRDGSISKAGSVLVGWRADDSFGGDYGLGSGYVLASDVTFRAVWAEVGDGIVFLADGGTLKGSMFEHSVDGVAEIDTIVAKDGFTFLGWRFADSADETVYASGLRVNAAGTVYMEPCLARDGEELKTISYDFDGGIGEVFEQKAVKGMRIALPAAIDMHRDGYVFAGWMAITLAGSAPSLGAGLGASAIANGTYVVSSEDVTFSAVWRSVSPDPASWDDDDEPCTPVRISDGGNGEGKSGASAVAVAVAAACAAALLALLAMLYRPGSRR